jgi:iron complex transport system ATP-binding protein
MNLINLKNLSFEYLQNGSNNFQLENLSLAINYRDFISILGPNGSGKSTLVKIIANIIKPQHGKRALHNKNYSEIARREFAKEIAFVPQNMSVNFPYSVYEIVMMGRSPHLNFFGMEKSRDHELVTSTLKQLEIFHLKDKGINEVSGGEAQRALIARAFVQKPKILLLDEPNAHLDVKHQLSIFKLLFKMNNEEGLTIVNISHDLNLAQQFSSRIILMKEGKILFDDKPSIVLNEYNIKTVFDVNSKIFPNQAGNNSFISVVP